MGSLFLLWTLRLAQTPRPSPSALVVDRDDELNLDLNIIEYLKFGTEERLREYIKDLNSILLINLEDLKDEID